MAGQNNNTKHARRSPLIGAWIVARELPDAIAVGRNTATKPLMREVLLMLADYMNTETRQCNPSHERLAAEIGFTERWIRVGIHALELLGLIRVHRSRGRRSNRYTLVCLNPEQSTGLADDNTEHSTGLTRNTLPGSEANSALNLEVNPEQSSDEPPEPNISPSLRSREMGQRRVNTASRFDEFWPTYPRKVKKQEALGIWKRKHLDALADIIIADVETRKARDREWLDGYVPHPTTYLRGRRWEDEIQERRVSPTGARDDNGRRPMSRAEEIRQRELQAEERDAEAGSIDIDGESWPDGQ